MNGRYTKVRRRNRWFAVSFGLRENQQKRDQCVFVHSRYTDTELNEIEQQQNRRRKQTNGNNKKKKKM